MPPVLNHGQISTYNNHKCRCEACRSAFASYMRAYRERADVKAKMRAYYEREDVKAARKAYVRRDDVKAKNRVHQKTYIQRLRTLAKLAIQRGLDKA